MTTVRDEVRVIVTKPVDGTKRRKRNSPRRIVRAMPVTVITVNKAVMAKAKQIIKPGQKLTIVSETEVLIINTDRSAD